MIVRIDDWVFDVDVQATAQYSESEAIEHCDCSYCTNFYAAVDENYPDFRSFMSTFGINLEAPDEMFPYEMDAEICYEGIFSVCGSIVTFGTKPIIVDGLTINPNPENTSQINQTCGEPCFFLVFSNLTLPWVLDEPLADVKSPVKEPTFVRRIWDRIFGQSQDNTYS